MVPEIKNRVFIFYFNQLNYNTHSKSQCLFFSILETRCRVLGFEANANGNAYLLEKMEFIVCLCFFIGVFWVHNPSTS